MYPCADTLHKLVSLHASLTNLCFQFHRQQSVLRRLIYCCLCIYYCCSYCVLGPCFVAQYYVSYLFLKSAHCGRESWLNCIYGFLMAFDCYCSLPLPHDVMCWYVVCNCVIYWPYSLTIWRVTWLRIPKERVSVVEA